MKNVSPELRSFLINGFGYVAGAIVGYLVIYLFGQLGLTEWLFGLVDEQQTFLQILAIPLIVWFMLMLGGAITGGIGGWTLANSIGTERREKLTAGSSIAFAATTSILVLIFLLLTSLIALYNNFTAERVEQFGILFGAYGLVFGLVIGLVQAFTTVRLRFSWRVILASTLGFMLGGIIAGLLIRWINPLDGLDTTPILTTLVLLLALAMPYFVGGGALGLSYRAITKLTVAEGEGIESAQSPRWQIVAVAIIALLIIVPVVNLVNKISGFLTIIPANVQSQISPESAGVRWSDPTTITGVENNFSFPGGSPGKAIIDGTGIQAWCNSEGYIQYQNGSGSVEQIDFPQCTNSPAAALDADGYPHLVWYAQEIRDTNGNLRPVSVIVESNRQDGVWSDPVIAALTKSAPFFSLSGDGDGNLILTWKEAADPTGNIYIAVKENYHCSPEDLNPAELAGWEALLDGETRPGGAEVPYCRNKFDRIIYLPNPEPEYSELPITPNGGFDQVSVLIEQAQYEVLFDVMQWMETDTLPSPGSIMAESVNKLYQKLKSNPQDYPRGLNVRILLGNYPVVADFTWGSQIIGVISDLKAAGVDKMVDPEIGWRVEVANYPGVYPHSHNKMIIVDGKLAGALGFNYSYLHFAADHPSGQGDNLFDLGLVMLGPVAQDTISQYDDMWDGADQVHCEDLNLPDGQWQDTCQELKATDDHVPEVLHIYLPPGGNTNSFSLYRTEKFNEADDFIAASLAASTKSIELITANFSLDLHCIINLLAPGFCTLKDSLPYIDSILEAVEKNGSHVRVIMENANSYGLENRVTAMVLYPELAKHGLEDMVELRFFNGRVHAKSALIDDSLLIIGSQNYQYSAWGKGGGLGENNITSDDPQAIAEYKVLFETKWEEAIPVDEAEYGATEK